MYYKYEVVYYDDSDKKQRKASGLVFAEYYSDAAKHLEDYYEGDFISNINIEATDNECPIYEIRNKEI